MIENLRKILAAWNGFHRPLLLRAERSAWPVSAAPPPYKKAVGEGEICSQSVTLRKRHCLFFFLILFLILLRVLLLLFFFCFRRGGGRAGWDKRTLKEMKSKVRKPRHKTRTAYSHLYSLRSKRFRASSSRTLGWEQKKGNDGEGRGDSDSS